MNGNGKMRRIERLEAEASRPTAAAALAEYARTWKPDEIRVRLRRCLYLMARRLSPDDELVAGVKDPYDGTLEARIRELTDAEVVAKLREILARQR